MCKLTIFDINNEKYEYLIDSPITNEYDKTSLIELHTVLNENSDPIIYLLFHLLMGYLVLIIYSQTKGKIFVNLNLNKGHQSRIEVLRRGANIIAISS